MIRVVVDRIERATLGASGAIGGRRRRRRDDLRDRDRSADHLRAVYAIDIIESIPEEGRAARTGLALRDEIEPIAESKNIEVRYAARHTKQELLDRLDWIVQEARTRQRGSLLQIEAHGDEIGIQTGSGECIDWGELKTPLSCSMKSPD